MASIKHQFIRLSVCTLTLCMLTACLLVASGCGTETTQSAPIGNGNAGASVLVANATGKDIEAFYLKRAGDNDYGEALAQGSLLADGAQASIAYPSDDDAAFFLKFMSNDGATYELCSLNFANMADATLKLSASGTSCYLEYTDANTGKTVSVVESEQKEQAAEEAEAKAEQEKANAKAAAKKAKKKAKAAEARAEEAEKKAKAAEEETKAAKEETEKIKEEYENYILSAKNDSASNTYSYSGSSSNGGSSSKSNSSSKSGSSSKGNSSSGSGSNSSSKGNSSSGSGSNSSSGSGSNSSKGSGGGEDNRCIEL